MTNLTVWVLALPLLGFIILSLAGRAMARPGVLTVALGTTGLAFLFAAISFLSIVGAGPDANPLTISFGLLYDPLSAVMLMVITGVGFLIHIYSAGYMHEEADHEFSRFFSYLNFFIFAMVLLVSA